MRKGLYIFLLRRTKFDLNKAKERAHILEGLIIAVNNIDEVIRTGVEPVINGGMIDVNGGWMGAGSAHMPLACFEAAGRD